MRASDVKDSSCSSSSFQYLVHLAMHIHTILPHTSYNDRPTPKGQLMGSNSNKLVVGKLMVTLLLLRPIALHRPP